MPLLARQVFGGGGAEDIAAMLPGSLGKGARELVKQRDAAAEDGDGEAEALAAIKNLYNNLLEKDITNRMIKYNLNPDRA